MNLIRVHLRTLGVGTALVLGLSACIASPRIVGPTHPSISPAMVRVFESPLIPRHYTVVAKLDAAWYGGCNSPGLDRIVLARLRRQAARLGANGILLVLHRRITVIEQMVPGVSNCFPQPLPKLAEAIYVRP